MPTPYDVDQVPQVRLVECDPCLCQELEHKTAFVPTRHQHATAVSERWSTVGRGWGTGMPHTINDDNQNYQGVGQDTWGRAIERAYRREDSEQWRRYQDQEYRDALNNARDNDMNETCEQEAEREVTRRANYKAQYVRELSWREQQQQTHNAKECDAEQQLAGAHLAEEEKRQWLEAIQDAAAHRASYARQLAARDAELRKQVEAQASEHLAQVVVKEEETAQAKKLVHDEALAAKFKADIIQRRGAETEERDADTLWLQRHRTFVNGFSYSAHRTPLPEPVKHSPCTKPRNLVYPIRGWRHKSHTN